MSARAAITIVFFLNGAGFASLFSRLPQIKSDLGLSDGQLGIALLGATLALLVAQPVAGALSVRRGSRAVTVAAGLAYAAALVLPSLATGLFTLTLALAVLGAVNGSLDVAMNVHGVAVERGGRRRILSSLHAAFSFGALAGALIGALAAHVELDQSLHLAGVGVAAAAAVLVARGGLLGEEADASDDAPLLARPTRALALAGALAFCVLLSEGSVGDWSAVYLRESIGTSAGTAAVGLAAFSLLMGTGRLLGDHLAGRFGPRAVVRTGAVFAVAGMCTAIAAGGATIAIAGFGLMGAGLSVVFPLALADAARREGADAGTAIAAISTAGYGGFIIGPPLIGFLSEAASLRAALGLVAVLCAVAAVLAGGLSRR